MAAADSVGTLARLFSMEIFWVHEVSVVEIKVMRVS
jgi:hypothetical protein